ncbi:DUF1259 domain-containing protein [Streptomyces specialis]|uniref:DUF1259 domain-containing protein n=1 Tax=Streptomyces specialis TaxID=498367 RepID=UPI00073F0158|nr:DUF1259 domain-containing protein [Streptomyces specialis]
MSRDSKLRSVLSAGTPRRRVMTAAALTPVLAGSITGAAVISGDNSSSHSDDMLEPVVTQESDWEKVARALGRPGDMRREMLWHTAFLRDDLEVTSLGYPITSSLALGTHVSFVRYNDGSTMLMGDLVVKEEELNGVTDALRRNGIAQTAIHKHLFAHDPSVLWTHVHDHGNDPVRMARGIRAAMDRTSTPPPATPVRPELDLDMAGMDEAMGIEGVQDQTVWKYSFVRRETISESHLILPPGLGSTTALIFQPVGDGKAILSGDLVMIADEVQDTLVALRRGGIDIVTLHNHGLRDEPRLFFFHIWAAGDPVRICRGLRRAVDTTDVVPLR